MNATDLEEVTAANQAFYAAFEAQDLDLMDACWLHDRRVRCIHPGNDPISGWPSVRRSWAAVFVASEPMQFFLTGVEVHVDGDTAVVTCTENVLTGPDLEAGKVVATNMFWRVDGGWYVVLRHASPVVRP